MTTTQAPVTARPSASLVIGRDRAAGWEILMALRNQATAFAGGALVFPGGALEPADGATPDDPLHGYRMAAIRETFEEVGILYAKMQDGDWPTSGLLAELAPERARLVRGELDFPTLLARHGLRAAVEELTYFAHWITPPERPKRFDTRFFLAELPPGQDGVHDGSELVDSFWTTPAQVVAQGESGEHRVMRATEVNCRRLATYARCAEARADFERHPESVVTPSYIQIDGVRYLSVPTRGNEGTLVLPAKVPAGNS